MLTIFFSFSEKKYKIKFSQEFQIHHNFSFIVIWKKLCLKINTYTHKHAYAWRKEWKKIQQNIKVGEVWVMINFCVFFFHILHCFYRVGRGEGFVFFAYSTKLNTQNRYDIFNISFASLQMLRCLSSQFMKWINTLSSEFWATYSIHLSLILWLCFYSLNRNAIPPSGCNPTDIFYRVLSSLFLVWLPIFLFIWNCVFRGIQRMS